MKKFSEETRRKMSEAAKARFESQEARDAVSIATREAMKRPEVREKLRLRDECRRQLTMLHAKLNIKLKRPIICAMTGPIQTLGPDMKARILSVDLKKIFVADLKQIFLVRGGQLIFAYLETIDGKSFQHRFYWVSSVDLGLKKTDGLEEFFELCDRYHQTEGLTYASTGTLAFPISHSASPKIPLVVLEKFIEDHPLVDEAPGEHGKLLLPLAPQFN